MKIISPAFLVFSSNAWQKLFILQSKMANIRLGATPPVKDDKHPALSLMLSMAMTTATYPLTTVKLLVQVSDIF